MRYYGWYSNRARRERNADARTVSTTLQLDETPINRKSKANWGEPEIEKGPVDLFPGERPHNGCAGWSLAEPLQSRQGWQARSLR